MYIDLFPHSRLSEFIIIKIIPLLNPMRIYIPWFMDPPLFARDKSIEVLYPPENMKPQKELNTVLSEYHRWAEQNHDRNYLEILKAVGDIEPLENTTWKIRQMITGSLQSYSGKSEEKTTRWHMLLHLAGELEEQRFEADNILAALKRKKPLLEGSIEKTIGVKSLFRDLPDLPVKSNPLS